MKKIICILLTALLAVSVFAGCSDTVSNPTPLTPVYANGISPDYGEDKTADPDTTEPQTPENTLPEGYTEYKDAYVSFIHPKSIAKKIDYYLLNSQSGAQIRIIAQDVQPDDIDFSNNIYEDLDDENIAEMCSEFVGEPESLFDLNIGKSKDGAYEITVVEYYENSEDSDDGDEEASRMGYAYIYVENSSVPDFNEIVLSISASEYPTDSIPEDHVNFSEIVKNIVETLSIVTAE